MTGARKALTHTRSYSKQSVCINLLNPHSDTSQWRCYFYLLCFMEEENKIRESNDLPMVTPVRSAAIGPELRLPCRASWPLCRHAGLPGAVGLTWTKSSWYCRPAEAFRGSSTQASPGKEQAGRHLLLKIESWRHKCAIQRNESQIANVQELIGAAVLVRECFQVKQPHTETVNKQTRLN